MKKAPPPEEAELYDRFSDEGVRDYLLIESPDEGIELTEEDIGRGVQLNFLIAPTYEQLWVKVENLHAVGKWPYLGSLLESSRHAEGPQQGDALLFGPEHVFKVSR